MKILYAVIFAICIVSSLYGKDSDRDENVFPVIEEAAVKWYEGRFGSTLYYESKLDSILYKLRRKNIDIPSDFILSKPDNKGDVALRCSFDPRKWLEVRGNISEVELEHIKVRYAGTRWWRFIKITGIKGTIRKYRIDRSFTEKRLILYIDNLQLTAGSNNDKKR